MLSVLLAAGGTYPLSQHFPHSKGGNAVRFAGRRGHVPVITASSPFKRGRCCPFFFSFWPPGACTRYSSIFPLQKGEMLSVFLLAAGGMYPRKYSIFPTQKGEMLSVFMHPLLGRCNVVFFSFAPWSFVVRHRAHYDSGVLEL